jgi:hypothetical protein
VKESFLEPASMTRYSVGGSSRYRHSILQLFYNDKALCLVLQSFFFSVHNEGMLLGKSTAFTTTPSITRGSTLCLST